MTRYLVGVAFVLVLLFAAAPLAQAASPFPFLSEDLHIVPDANDLDPSCLKGAPLSYGAVLEIIHRLMNVAVSVAIVGFTIILIWAGILFIMSPLSPENRTKARGMIMNGVMGIVIVLAGWLIVDFVMKALYSGPDGTEGRFGPWNSLLGTGKACITKVDTKELFSGGIIAKPGLVGVGPDVVNPGEGTTPATGTGANCPVPAESTMVMFPSSVVVGGSGKATPETVKNFMAMREAALKDGIDLKVSSAYRSDASQVTLWNQNCPSGKCRVDTAKPCSLGGNGSNHNSGQAIDIRVGCSNGQSNCNTPAYRWLKTNGAKWNFRNALPDDPVHWSPSGR